MGLLLTSEADTVSAMKYKDEQCLHSLKEVRTASARERGCTEGSCLLHMRAGAGQKSWGRCRAGKAVVWRCLEHGDGRDAKSRWKSSVQTKFDWQRSVFDNTTA